MTTQTPHDLTLRDYFAAHALMGIMANCGESLIRDINANAKTGSDVSKCLMTTGTLCYAVADSMVKAGNL